jgi:acetyl esterase/lipase
MKLLPAIMFLSFLSTAAAQQVRPLYPDTIPNAIPGPDQETTEIKPDGVLVIHQISKPTIAVYLPSKRKATGTAVIIFPGGGYSVNAYQHEGIDVAKQLVKMGVAAFVVKYRVPNPATMPNPTIGPLQDAQQAIKMVRENASAWGINSSRLGVLGFSAGGHLAASAGTHFQEVLIPNAENTSVRPDFMVLIYPVISFMPGVGHSGSSDRLIGKNPTEALQKAWSNELLVNAQTPPTFLVHATDDGGVSPLNSILFYEALRKNKVATEMHLYQRGGHGFGLYIKGSKVRWMDACREWMGL